MGYSAKRYFLLLVPSLLLLATVDMKGQSTQSTILGTVTDPSGGVIVGATVEVTNEGTSFKRQIMTDQNGDYRVAGLERGSYEVRVTSTGFNTFVRNRIVLESSQIKRVDASMQVGETATTVTVTGDVGLLETETAALSNVKSTQDFVQLPQSVYGRGWPNVVFVTAGVQSGGVDGCCGVVINGARDTANNFTSDGIVVNDVVSSRQTANGFPGGDIESYQEFKVMTANNSAEYSQVAQMSMISRSGSNGFHGSFYWGNFNSRFNARAWNDPTKPSFENHNMFAINNGGPVYLPKIYDGRDKTFYFFHYSGARYRTGSRTRTSVPPPAFRQGDFSALLGQITIVDPLTGVPFNDNKIPGDRISSVSRAVQDLVYPDPNLTGLGDFGITENFYADPGYKFNADGLSTRVDHKITNSNTLFVRVGLTIHNHDVIKGAMKDGYGSSSFYGNVPGRTVVISDTHTFSPTLVNEGKLGYSRNGYFGSDYNFGKQPDLGIEGIDNPANDPAIGGLPNFSFSGAIPFESTGTWVNSYASVQNDYQAVDNLSWYRGRHTFKMGADVRRYQVNDVNNPTSLRGAYNFDDRLSGLAYANFLLGFPSYAERAIARPSAYLRSTQVGFYFQDDFKINQSITFNYGLRYEYQSPWVDKYDRLFTFDPSTGSLVTAGTSIPTDLVPAVAATLPIKSASEAGFPTRSLMEKDSNNWSPRFGLAIRPFADATTVVRLGYGLYSQLWPGSLGLNATGGPWQSTESFFIEGNQPSIRFPRPFVTTSEFSGLQGVAGLSVKFPNERTQQWNVSVGRQIWNTAVEIGYVGTKAKNIPFVQDLNLLHPSTEPYSSARRPYQRFNAVSLTQSGGSSIYHGLNIQADRKMSGGLSLNANYTWAKALTDVALSNYAQSYSQNQYSRYLERGDDDWVRRQQLRFSYIYELPFGRGKRFLNGLASAPNYVLGGWQFSGITTMVTGRRLSPSFSGTDPANTNQFGGRPDRIGDGNLDSGGMRDRIKGGSPIFDSEAFVQPVDGRGYYGNSARNILTGPGGHSWNMILAKNFQLKEQARLQFRWEIFNLLNRANFSNPSTNISGGDFGLVTSAGNMRKMLFALRLDY
ncbi:MAG TPA: TonB-dependent receptor [Bryobacteraceae bacterium]|nr:TonB-dependent receptor [Bryobacteraceae bacterium]